jgi:ABC-type antimicrobial peptide transport system permease subunit
MDIVRYIGFSVTGLLAGGAVGCLCGLSLGWLLALGYHRHGPSDPGDAPAYVAIGLVLVGTILGAITGLVTGFILARRKSLVESQ